MKKIVTILIACTTSLLTFAQAEAIELTFDQFYSDPIYYEGPGDWVITLRDEAENQFVFDFFGSPDTYVGTYSSADGKIDLTFSAGTYQGERVKYASCELVITSTHPTINSTIYQLEANILSTEGVNFIIHATHEIITPMQSVEGTITDAQITLTDYGFLLDAQNTDLELDMLLSIKTTETVQGYYNNYFVDSLNTTFSYKGKSFIPAELNANVEFTNTLSNDQAGYAIQMTFLTADTIFVQLEIEAPIIPIDTVELHCENLKIDQSLAAEQEKIYFTASNSTYDIWGAYSDTKLKVDTYEGSDDIVSVRIDNLVTGDSHNALKTTLQVSLEEFKYAISFSALATNHILYVTTLKQTSTTTNLTNLSAPAQTIKIIENGQMMIIKGGVKYNILGMKNKAF